MKLARVLYMGMWRIWLRTGLIAFLFIAGMGSAYSDPTPPRGRTVSGEFDVAVYQMAHVARVAATALAAYDSYPEKFPDINPQLILRYTLSTHDYYKYHLDTASLQKMGLSESEETMAAVLDKIWGERIANLPGPVRKHSVRRIQLMNSAERRLGVNFADISHLSRPQMNELDRVVHIGDIVERANYPTAKEELGGSVTPEEAWLSGEDLFIAQAIRRSYFTIISDLKYEKFKSAFEELKTRNKRQTEPTSRAQNLLALDGLGVQLPDLCTRAVKGLGFGLHVTTPALVH